MSNKKEFEKLFIYLGDQQYSSADIAIANCPDDWTTCSFIVSTHRGSLHGFVKLLMNESEVDQVIEALQKVKVDMHVLPSSGGN